MYHFYRYTYFLNTKKPVMLNATATSKIAITMPAMAPELIVAKT